MIKCLFISDNYYLCNGMLGDKFNAIYISSEDNCAMFSSDILQSDYVVIATENTSMCCKLLKKLQKYGLFLIVLLPYIEKNTYFKINKIVYSSLASTPFFLKRLSLSPPNITDCHLTRREKQVLAVCHLDNKVIAKIFSISQKTASGYRMSLQSKLNLNVKNHLAMLRLQSIISHSKYKLPNKNRNY